MSSNTRVSAASGSQEGPSANGQNLCAEVLAHGVQQRQRRPGEDGEALGDEAGELAVEDALLGGARGQGRQAVQQGAGDSGPGHGRAFRVLGAGAAAPLRGTPPFRQRLKFTSILTSATSSAGGGLPGRGAGAGHAGGLTATTAWTPPMLPDGTRGHFGPSCAATC